MILGDSLLPQLVPGHPDAHIGNSSIDLRLHDEWLIPCWPDDVPFVVGTDMMRYSRRTGDLLIGPHQFVLCRTLERVQLPLEVAGWVEGRSSIGRLGVWVQNAGYVDSGFEGTITLEVYNGNNFPIQIPAGYRITQLVAALTTGVTFGYNGKFQNQTNCTGFKNDNAR